MLFRNGLAPAAAAKNGDEAGAEEGRMEQEISIDSLPSWGGKYCS